MAEQQIIDALGKIVTVGEGQTDILKALAEAMGASVGGKKDGPKEKEEDKKHKKLIEVIEELPDLIHDAFKKELKEATDLLTKISKKKGGGGGGRGGGGSGGSGKFGAGGILDEAKTLLGMNKELSDTEDLMIQISKSMDQVKLNIPGATDNLKKLVNRAEGGSTEFNRMYTYINKVNAEMEGLLTSEKLTDKQADRMGEKYKKLEEILYEISNNERKYGRRKTGALKEQLELLRKTTAEYNAGKVGLEEVEKQQQVVLKTANDVQKASKRWSMIEAAGDIALAGNAAKQLHGVFKGAIHDSMDYQRETARLAATIEGPSTLRSTNKVKRELQEQLDITVEMTEAAHAYKTTLDKEVNKQLKKGVRSLSETRDITATAAAGAWQIGASAEATSEEFQKWNMQIGMSSRGANSLARTMATTAKQTGVMGDNLLHAVEAAREIAQMMKDTGTYSQDVANSLIGWQASAQKFGVAKQMQDIFKASQGGLEAFMNASAETRNLLASAGQINKTIKGETSPDEVMQGTEKALVNAIKQAGGGKAFEAGSNVPDLTKLDKKTISRLDLIMKKRFGMKLGESTRLLEAIQDQTDPQKGIDRIVKQLANPNITDAQKQSLELQKKQLEATKREKEVNKMLDGFDKMAQAALKDGATMDSILKEAKLTKEQATKNSADLTDKLSEKLKAAGKDFKSVVGMNEGELKKKMEQALKEGNVKEFNTLTNKLSEANKLADSAAKNNSNLQDKKETQEMKLNNRLLHALQPLADLLAASPLWLSNLVTIAGGIWAVYRLWSQGGAYAAIKGTFKTLKDTLGTKGSGWVHDPYVEKVNVGMAKNIALLAKNKAGWVGVKRRRDHTDIGGKVVPKAKVVGGGGGGLGGLLGGGMGGMGGLAGMGKTVAALAALGPIIMAIGVAIAFIMGMFSEEEMQEIFKPLIDVWTELKNVLKGELTSLLKDAVATITPIIKDMLPMFIDIIKTVFTVVKPVVEVLMQLVAIVMQVYSIFYQLIWAVLKPLWMIVGTLFKVFAKIIKAVLKPFIIIFRLFGKIIGKLVKIFGKLFEPLLEKFVKLIEYLISPLEMAADWLEKMLAPLDAMGDSFESLEKPLNEVWQVVKWLLAPFKVLWEGLKKVWKVIKVILSPLTAFWDILTKLWNIGKDITLPFQMFWDVLTKLWDVGKNLISPLTTIVDVLSQIMSFDFSGLASNFANAVGGIFSTAANKVGEMFGNIANGAKTLADTGRGIIQSGAESLGLGAEAKAVGDFFDSLNPFHTGGMVGGPPGMEIPLVAQAGEAILTPDQQMFVSESMSRLIDTIGSIQKQMDSLKQPSNIFEIGASLIDRIFPSATPSMNRGDFDSQIQAKVQSSQPSAASSAATTQLAEIAANTAATVDELQNAVDVLEDIRDKMNGGSGSSDTRSKTKPRGTPNFFNWAFGRFSDTSAKQRVNPGY